MLVPTRGMCAVAAVFDPSLDLLLIRRTERPGDPWSGHISFPGGRMEPTDDDALAAAIRETWEEVGLSLDRRHLLGQLDDVAAVGGKPGMVIRPFVFAVDALPSGSPNDEVAELLRLPLAALLSGAGRGPMTLSWRGVDRELARVDFPAATQSAHHRLWGLTLRMVDDLLHRIDGRGIGLERLPR